MFKTNYMPLNWHSFPVAYPVITAAYGLDRSTVEPNGNKKTALNYPSLAFEAWVDLAADIGFRLPPIFLAQENAAASVHNESNTSSTNHGEVFVYSIRATNPFPLWSTSYRRANHAINEIFLFDVASDLVPAAHLLEYRGAVSAIQRSWIAFCYGKRPWSAMKSAAGAVYVFDNSGKSQEYATVRDAEGEITERRWMAILDAASEVQRTLRS
jgi:hypothetical protein